jgi:transposase
MSLPLPFLPRSDREGSNRAMHLTSICALHLYRVSGVDFTQIDGVGVLTVLTLLSELGLDPSRFPTLKHFVSWFGLCPGSRITGGKCKSSKTRPVANRVATALRMAAQTLVRSHSALGAFYPVACKPVSVLLRPLQRRPTSWLASSVIFGPQVAPM